MSISSEVRRQLDSLIRSSNSILVLVPKDPSNDAISGAIALIQILQKWGKKSLGFSSSLLPKVQYLFENQYFVSNLDDYRDLRISIPVKNNQTLQVINTIYQTEKQEFDIMVRSNSQGISKETVYAELDQFNFDLIITIGISGIDKFDDEIAKNPTVLDGHHLVNIDYHQSNSEFGSLNIIDKQQVSTSQLIYELFKPYGANVLAGDTATALLAGLMANTNRFISPNTNSELFRQAAHLIDLGARNIDIGYCLFGDTDKFIANQAKKALKNQPKDNTYQILPSSAQSPLVDDSTPITTDNNVEINPPSPVSTLNPAPINPQFSAPTPIQVPVSNTTPTPYPSPLNPAPINPQFSAPTPIQVPVSNTIPTPYPSPINPATVHSNSITYPAQEVRPIPNNESVDRPVPPKTAVPDWQKLSSIINNKYQDNPLNKLNEIQKGTVPKSPTKKSLAEELIDIDNQNNPLIY